MSRARRRAVGLAVLAALALGAVADSARSHTRSRSDSWWRLEDAGASVRLRMSLLDLSRLPPERFPPVAAGDPVGAYLATRLRMHAGEAPCELVEPPRRSPAREGWAAWRWRVTCPDTGPPSIETALLLPEAPSHLHFVRVEGEDGAVMESLLAGSQRRLELAAGATPVPRASGLVDYLLLGVEHIATGWDHLAFVLGLLLLATSWRELALLVTSFTLAHSVTLALAVLGVVRPEPGAVEALIGFSIALIAAENAWLLGGRGRWVPGVTVAILAMLGAAGAAGAASLSPATAAGLALFTACHFALLGRASRPGRLRAGVAFGFGLVHGFGFAGILTELELPTDRLVPALFGFNLGVELGQLAVVAVCWPLLLWIAARDLRGHRLVAELGSAAVAGLGVYWWIGRTLG